MLVDRTQKSHPSRHFLGHEEPRRSSDVRGLARGIKLGDVLGAADALVDGGVKPTIVRVRKKLGRSSPNTVNPMLDVWFSTLGQRLKGRPFRSR